MKRIIALIVGSLLLLTACTKQNTTVAETSPTPTLPPNRGPSAVFTATPDPNATPCPTKAPTPTPTIDPRFVNTSLSTADNHKYYGFEPCCSSDVGLAAAKFDYDTDPFDSKRRDGESAEEYKTRMFANIQAAYDELLGGLDSMTSLYICIRSYGNSEIYLPQYQDLNSDICSSDIYVVLRGKSLEKWKSFIRSSMLKFNNDYNDDETGPVRAGCADSSIIYCFENKDGKLFRMFNNTEIRPLYRNSVESMAELKFNNADKRREFSAFQRRIETEAVKRLYDVYFSPACYPFLDIDEPIYSSKPKSVLNDKFLYSVGTPAYRFDIEKESAEKASRFGCGETVYVCVEKDGKKYYAAFAQSRYIDKLQNLISMSTTVDCSAEEMLPDGGRITFCVGRSGIIAKAFSTNGVCFDACGIPARKIKFRNNHYEKEFMSLQQRIYDEVLKMRTTDSPYCFNHVIDNIE